MSRSNLSPQSSEPSAESPAKGPSDSARVSSSSPQHVPLARESESSEGYPSWLPKRPPPPAPASTIQSSVAMFSEQLSPEPVIVGRKPTPRSVRIVSVGDSQEGDGGRREPTDQTRVGQPGHSRVWSRATTAGMSPSALAAYLDQRHIPPPRFRANGLHLKLLRNPSLLSRLHFYLLPLIAFYHIPLQTFFDFNAVFILIQVAKYPNPVAPGVPGSGKNWALGAAAYVGCWLAWIVVVFIVYELVYSFYRRWRIRRPLILPVYMSSSAFNLASMTSYNTHSFFQHLRLAAFSRKQGGCLRDGLSETFWFYSQNVATVALLLPRAGLSLALLLAFSSIQPDLLAIVNTGNALRDKTFFRPQDGTLTNYARGVLIANAAWTAWRTMVLLVSWFGLWILSGHGCAGICGPRLRSEEEAVEKNATVYDDDGVLDLDALPWSWRHCTRLRIQDAYDFCLTTRHPSQITKKEVTESDELPVSLVGMEQVLAAVGFPSSPQPTRRGAILERMFETPTPDPAAIPEMSQKTKGKTVVDFASVIPPVREKESRDVGSAGPSQSLPYPFTGHRGAQVSSEEQVPFPPSPRHSKSNEGDEADQDANKENVDVEPELHDDEIEDNDEMELGEAEDEHEPSSGHRTSGSLSSLGQPVPSRYPFQYRRPRGGSSMSSQTRMTPRSMNSRSTQTQSTPSRSTQSTGNMESTDSPWSNGSSNAPSPMSEGSSGIPRPPRHPQFYQSRTRTGAVPAALGPPPVFFRARTRTESGSTSGSRLERSPVYESSVEEVDELPMEQPEAEGPHEEAEREDSLGLLSAAPSPRTSLIGVKHRPSNLTRRRHGSSPGSRSSSQSRSPAVSTTSSSRSRAQSLIQSLGAASKSSLDLMRSRANSMARLSDSPYNSNSDVIPSSPENNTFGHPYTLGQPSQTGLPSHREFPVEQGNISGDAISSSDSAYGPIPQLRVSLSMASGLAPSEFGSEPGTIDTEPTAQAIPIPLEVLDPESNQADISPAPEPLITAPIQSAATENDDPVGHRTLFGDHSAV